MKLEAKLNAKFYIIFIFLLVMVALIGYGTYFINTNQVLMEDGLPMSAGTELIFTVALCVIGLSWLASFLVLLRQIFIGCAFEIDADGIHSTVIAFYIFAFIFVVPIRTIPYNAIKSVSEKNGVLTLSVDKSRLDMIPFLRFLARKEYHLFSGFTTAKKEDIKRELSRYIKTDNGGSVLIDE